LDFIWISFMSTLLPSKSLYYKDVNLIAQPGQVKSRELDVPRERHRIIVAPMSAIVGIAFAKEALSLGLQVCLHRFCTIEEEATLYQVLGETGYNSDRVWASIGFEDWDRFEALRQVGCYRFVIDVANGYLPRLPAMVKTLVDEEMRLIVGNVHTVKGYADLVMDGTHEIFVRLGIGNGSVCGTSDITGYNRGQITEIMECHSQRMFRRYLYGDIIADGGVADSGCAAKAFGAGADYVMMGGYFRNAQEAKNVIDGNYEYWGGASHKQQLLQYGSIKRHSEGKAIPVVQSSVKPLETLVNDLWGGLASAISYSGCKTLSEFIGQGVFEEKA
jgi:GMP reductase